MSDIKFVGPFEEWVVVVNGHIVPHLTAVTDDGGGVHLSLDNRTGIDLTESQALDIVPFIVDCIAIAMGYSCFPCPELPEPPPYVLGQRSPAWTPTDHDDRPHPYS